jgi:predicted DCC family thiol-disulfide oxidoreductase YuxK
MQKMKVYYNSACPVCDAGIKDQRCRMEAQGIEDVEWLDVHTRPELVQEVSAELEQVRERLHVKSADGTVHVGADALAALFVETRRRKWLGGMMRSRFIRPLAQSSYDRFARLLYRWNRRRKRW